MLHDPFRRGDRLERLAHASRARSFSSAGRWPKTLPNELASVKRTAASAEGWRRSVSRTSMTDRQEAGGLEQRAQLVGADPEGDRLRGRADSGRTAARPARARRICWSCVRWPFSPVRDADPPARPQHAPEGEQRAGLLGQPVEHRVQHHDVEAAVGQAAEVVGVADLEGEVVARRGWRPGRCAAAADRCPAPGPRGRPARRYARPAGRCRSRRRARARRGRCRDRRPAACLTRTGGWR